MFRKCAFAALALVLAACRGSVPQPPAALPGTCSSDTECKPGFRCDHELRRCVCASDAACGAGTFCNAFTGNCVTSVGGFTSNAACGAGQYCNTALRTCKAITPFCQGNACIPDSLKPCAADADCADPAQACDQTMKACITRSSACPAGDACDPQSRLCVQACASDADCLTIIERTPGYQCRNNACYRLALCARDSDCSGGQICLVNPDGSSSCHPGCVSNADCPVGSACDTTDPAHERCAPGCTQNTDCPLNTVCSGGACVSTTASCATQACQDTAVCPVGGTCVNNCCVEADLPSTCGESACGPCPTASPWCTVKCASSCFPMNLGPCATLADCTSRFPALADVRCNATVGQCQVWGHLQPCSSSADCPMKGFKCLPGANVGCGGSGSVCFPTEQAAQTACGVGHP